MKNQGYGPKIDLQILIDLCERRYEAPTDVCPKTEQFKIGKILFIELEAAKPSRYAPLTTIIKFFFENLFRYLTLILHYESHSQYL